jgi:hypothetical protein
MSEKQEFVNRRKSDFKNDAERVKYDAENLIEIANAEYGKPAVYDVLFLTGRREKRTETDNLDTPEYIALLKHEITLKIKGSAPIIDDVDTEFEISGETNEKGVSMQAITAFLDTLKLQFGVSKEKVLERLITSLSIKKLRNLMYFQSNGHELDVTGIDSVTGELEFDTCSMESPKGENGEHRDKTYFQALDIATENGATLMTTDKYKWFETQGIVLDTRSCWSWLYSPDAENRLLFDGCGGSVYNKFYPGFRMQRGGFRVSLKV